MSDAAAVRRQLKIKTGAAARLHKETGLYRKEVLQLEAKRTKLVQDGAEEWDIKNAGKMMDESNKLVLDTEERLNKAKEELQALVTAAKDEHLSEVEELAKAEEVLEKINTKT